MSGGQSMMPYWYGPLPPGSWYTSPCGVMVAALM